MKQNINFKVKYNQIKNVINEIDPLDLIGGGAPLDEYENEVAKITSIMSKTKNLQDISVAINDVFYKNFGENIEDEKLKKMVNKLLLLDL